MSSSPRFRRRGRGGRPSRARRPDGRDTRRAAKVEVMILPYRSYRQGRSDSLVEFWVVW
jgi:hypothetical protein